ncbi:MAG: hypothetical protein HFE64_07230 [Lachnospiraceae bacterium]|jgi:hypothetical protein|nr:hypothetical protein [Lachnospiraceae bacterium]
MSKKRKMDTDDKRKAFTLGVALMMLFIILYFMFIHRLLGGDAAPWQLVDGIVAGGSALSFVVAYFIVKLRMGEAHAAPEEANKHKKFED